MFDDIQPPKTGNTPNNLPLGEPEDIFEQAEPVSQISQNNEPVEEPINSIPNTALDAGVLRPKAPVTYQASTETNSAPVASSSNSTYSIQTPSAPFLQQQQNADQHIMEQATEETPFSARKILVLIGIILIIALLGFGSFSIYTRYIKNTVGESGFSNGNTTNNTTVDTPSITTEPLSNVPTAVEQTTSSNSENSILFGEPTDTDSDGIIDVDESQYGTDTLNWDTDGDGLSDGDEVLIWKTNPLNSDTDTDGYTDSEEIRNGYSPLGTGKLFEPPTTTESSTTTL